ncbi:MAG: ABC transporter ATP-binding protein/permease [Gemmatimonadetes bacterium]|nr:ABC transporter ATP-binding protein/permease [Gemmatimonadota bacterium]
MTSLTRLLPWARPYLRQFVWGLACVVVSTALANLMPTLIRRAIDAMAAGAPVRAVLDIAATMVGLTLVMGWFRFQMRNILNGVSRVVENDLRDALFARLTRLDPAWYGRNRTGEVMARLTNDLGAVRMAVGPAVMYLTNTIFGGIFALSFMFSISPRLTLLALLPMVPLPIVTLGLGRAIHRRFERVQAQFGDLTTHVQEHLSGVRIVRAYQQEGAELARFTELSAGYLGKNLRLVRLNGLMNPSFALLAGLGAAAVLGLGGAMVLAGTLSIGAFVAFGLYLANLTWPLIALGWVTSLFQRGAASMTRLLAILDAQPAIRDSEPPRGVATLPPTVGGRTLTFERVGFTHAAPDGTAGRTVLRDVSVSVPAGSTLGIVGATGSSKTTLLELIPRLADPTQGRVLLDGVDVRDLPLDVLRREIGFVPQESLLFSETIIDNLMYGSTSEADAHWAAGVAQLTEAIDGFPGGFATMLGERGVNLSGGQKQRAAMARALARRPSVVILDDALSAVDTHTEAAILRGLREALAGRTAVIASHRITAIRDAHWIIVLDDGLVVEQGRHEELLAARGRYWTLLRRQQMEEELEVESVPAGA